jgi:hypothetical protein
VGWLILDWQLASSFSKPGHLWISPTKSEHKPRYTRFLLSNLRCSHPAPPPCAAAVPRRQSSHLCPDPTPGRLEPAGALSAARGGSPFAGFVLSFAGRHCALRGGDRGVRGASVGEGDGHLPGRPRLGLVACGCVLDSAFYRCLLLYLPPVQVYWNSTILPLYALCCWWAEEDGFTEHGAPQV